MRRTVLLFALFLAACPVTVTSPPPNQPLPPPPPNRPNPPPPDRPTPPPPTPSFTWDSSGWTLLGERTVEGRVDSDVIDVSQKLGQFNKLTVVVLDSDLEMVDFNITFVRGTKYAPDVKQVFRENSRTRAIALPSREILRKIEFKYRNLPGGGRARVQVWGQLSGDTPPPPPPAWNSTGWTMIGERTVDGRVDNDKIDVSQKIGKFNQLTVVVLDSDLEMIDFAVQFVRGTRFNPPVNHYFRENTRTKVIDLPSTEILRRIEFKYRNLPGGGRARVQVWGRLGPERPAPPPVWNSTGWTLVGERTVDGRVDSDKIDISQKIGRITKLTVVVLDSDLEMIDFTITFVRGTMYSPQMKHVFRESSRTRTIDLPAAEILRRIEFKYRNLPGGGRARVQVWGKA